MGLGPAVVVLHPSAAGRARWPQSPSEGVQPDDCPDRTHCAGALHKPVLPQARSASPGHIMEMELISLQYIPSQTAV